MQRFTFGRKEKFKGSEKAGSKGTREQGNKGAREQGNGGKTESEQLLLPVQPVWNPPVRSLFSYFFSLLLA